MAPYRLTETAQRDVASILNYIANDNPSAATRLLARFERQAKKLALAPGIGQLRAYLRPELRSSVVGSYLIFYRAVPNGIEIVRVLHGRRDIDALFADDN